jgi:fermentation-respiration switch protein FrsA (DUF1100 family)
MHVRVEPGRTRWSAGRIVLAVLATLVFLYVGAIGWLMSQETQLVFQAGRPLGEARPTFPYEQVDLPRPDGARQFGWVMRTPNASADPWILYLHGNSATVASRVNIARYGQLRALGLNVLAPEYRGFAGLDGVPSEAGLASDARAGYDYLRHTLGVPAERIVTFGWSLGSGVAVRLASDTPQAAVILEGAFASIADIGQRAYPIFPIRLVMRNRFESIRLVDRIRAPMLFLHSPEDTIIPLDEGRRLYDAAPPPKRFVEVRGGHIHANDVDRAVFDGAIRSFLLEQSLIR